MHTQELSQNFTQNQQMDMKAQLGELCRMSMQAGDGSQEAKMNQHSAKKKVDTSSFALLSCNFFFPVVLGLKSGIGLTFYADGPVAARQILHRMESIQSAAQPNIQGDIPP